MKRPKKGDRLENRKSGAVVRVEGFTAPKAGQKQRVKLRNESSGRRSEPTLDNVKKQYHLIGEPDAVPDSPTEPRPVVEPGEALSATPEEAAEALDFGPDDPEEETDPDPDEPYDGAVAAPELMRDYEESPFYIKAVIFASGGTLGLICGVALDYALRS